MFILRLWILERIADLICDSFFLLSSAQQKHLDAPPPEALPPSGQIASDSGSFDKARGATENKGVSIYVKQLALINGVITAARAILPKSCDTASVSACREDVHVFAYALQTDNRSWVDCHPFSTVRG